ncbi:MAG TPA: diphosphate--fructose-6-phosphate 1-phosphotransferase, partial [Rhodocyclaceae bacterium]|nr:diphosphate--fructose-6-phosphate 1-phosphotransferase [Rhodocyclaceae bacterium]
MKSLTETLIAMERHRSIFENEIRTLPVPVCRAFGDQAKPMPPSFVSSGQVLSTRYSNSVGASFPHTTSESGNAVLRSSSSLAAMPKGKRVAALFSGGPASGGHNVLCGLKTILGSENTLLGVRGGPKGLLSGKLFVINDDDAAGIVNTGGFDFLGTDRTKIKTDEQYRQVKQVCTDNQIDAIVIIGGDDSNTNAALLAEYLHSDVRANDAGVPVGVQVIGVPKTIDGDLQVEGLLPISFGFDTATKIYAEMVGNILQDTPSSRKYWHFVKLMGRSASHVTLEVALQTKPAVALISEELAQRKLSLSAVIDMIANTVIARGRKGIYHGVVLIPEGLLEFIPQVKSLIDELNDKLVQLGNELAQANAKDKCRIICEKLTVENAQLLTSLPDYIQDMLLADRDSHGNLPVSLI